MRTGAGESRFMLKGTAAARGARARRVEARILTDGCVIGACSKFRKDAEKNDTRMIDLRKSSECGCPLLRTKRRDEKAEMEDAGEVDWRTGLMMGKKSSKTARQLIIYLEAKIFLLRNPNAHTPLLDSWMSM
jgi:hypothetical protein